jgi:hypothetical protein
MTIIFNNFALKSYQTRFFFCDCQDEATTKLLYPPNGAANNDNESLVASSLIFYEQTNKEHAEAPTFSLFGFASALELSRNWR